jgi:hypothetical protein
MSATAPAIDTQALHGVEAVVPAVESVAQNEISAAWQNHKKNGLAFGQICYDWSKRLGKSKGGYGSKGEGLSEILRVLEIPRHIVDYWIGKYEASVGQGIPCSHCSETFPSNTQLKKHQHKSHCHSFEICEPKANQQTKNAGVYESFWGFKPENEAHSRLAIDLVSPKRRRTVVLSDERRAALTATLAAARAATAAAKVERLAA